MPLARSTPWIVLAGLTLGCGSSVTIGSPDAGNSPSDLGPSADQPDVPAAADAPASCRLPGGGVCLVGQSCRHPDGCNTCSCYGGGEFAACTLIGCVPIDAGPSFDRQAPIDLGPGGCYSSADCGADRECRFTVSGCGALGTCGFITDCAAVVPYCSCSGETFRACPTAPDRPWVSRGECASDAGPAVDAPLSPDAAQCGGASLGRGGGYCAGPDDGPLPVTCCTGWNCDPRMVACNRVPPSCAAGEVPSVSFSCYGPCVPATHCAPIACDRECPGGWRCDATTGTCRFGG